MSLHASDGWAYFLPFSQFLTNFSPSQTVLSCVFCTTHRREGDWPIGSARQNHERLPKKLSKRETTCLPLIVQAGVTMGRSVEN